MRALALKQPWASLVASGRKTIELRSWRTTYRGPLIVVASMKTHPHLDARALGIDDMKALPHGVVLAVVDLVDVRPFARGDESCAFFDPGDDRCFSWTLRDARPLRKHVALVAKLGVFRVDPAIVRAVARQLR